MRSQFPAGEQTGSQHQADYKEDGAPVTSPVTMLAVRRRHAARRPVNIPKPRLPLLAEAPAGLDTEAERDRQMEIRYAGTSPQGRQIIRMKLFDLKRTLRRAEGTVLEELATIQKLIPASLPNALSPQGAGPMPQDIGEQAASHLKKTERIGVYLAAVERLSAAYEEIKNMPAHQEKAQLVVGYRALADRLRQPAREASTRIEQERAGELAGEQGREGAARGNGPIFPEAQHGDAATIDTPPQIMLPQIMPPKPVPTTSTLSPIEPPPPYHPLTGFSMAEARRRGLA